MKLLIISNGYPKENDLYNNAFIHARNILYKDYNIEVIVYVLKVYIDKVKEYNYESIKVIEGNEQDLLNLYGYFKPDKIAIHFLNRYMMRFINKIEYKTPIVVFVHGFEALGWYRRLYDFKIDKKFLKYIIANSMQMFNLRKFINESQKFNVKFIFVSNWMKKVMEHDTFTKVKNYKIIPNVIDSNLFKYNKKNYEHRKKILTIRPFESKKYANDLIVEAILQLSKKDFFHELEFYIYGDGKYFNKLTDKIKKFDNVHIFKKYIKHNEINKIHKDFGIFLCPTRQDSQGVSMCEAMSSGLVPITSNNTAIPEFVTHMETGFLTNNVNEIANSIELMYKNPNLFLELSSKAANSVKCKCDKNIVIKEEIEILKEELGE